MSSPDVPEASPPESAPSPRRSLHPVEFVEELATTKQRCAALQRLFAYRKRLLEANPLWFTQLVTGPLLDPTCDPERATVHTLFVGARGSATDWTREMPELFVDAVIRSRFGVEGSIVVATEPSEIFGAARAFTLSIPQTVELPLLTAKDEGAARAILETRRNDVRKGRAARSAIAPKVAAALAPPSPLGESASVPAPAVGAPPASATPAPEARSALSLVAYELDPRLPLRLRTAPHDREWIESSPGRFAARCLPLLIANQSGWEVVIDGELTATWDGKPHPPSVKIDCLPRTRQAVSSHFGLGILTFHLPFVFRTPPGYNLLVRGPCNRPKAGISPLEGVVETDWTAATFTMNWQMTDVGRPVRFETGEVVAMIVPQRRGELELFEPRIVPLLENPDLASRHELFAQSRDGFLKDLETPGSAARDEQWQRYYFQGSDPDGTIAPEHQTKLKLKPFA